MDLKTELAKYGPGAPPQSITLVDARSYCRRLAESHYENFTVVSWLWPRRLHQHLCNVYAYCRWADDLADESATPQQALVLLDWWQQQLREAQQGNAVHPVFVALQETMHEFQLPEAPLLDLLTAFRRDQSQTRYDTFADLLDYCRCSANPVGRIVLHLGRSVDERTVALSDSICTGLQLANFCQDVARDHALGRVYLPQEDLDRVNLDDVALAGPVNSGLQQMLAEQCDRARQYLVRGEPLAPLVSRELRLPVRLFIDGGLAILGAIERRRYDVWTERPTVGKLAKARLLATAWWRVQAVRTSSMQQTK